MGFSLGEAAYACQNSLSWQTTVLGDPLYRPFRRTALEQHQDLHRRKSKLIEWSHLKVVNMNLATALPVEQLIGYLETTPETETSAVLLEKLADLYFLKAKWTEAVSTYRKAIEQSPTPQQHVRLTLALARTLDLMGNGEEALAVYQQFIKDFPDYPDLPAIQKKLAPLAEQLGKAEQKEQHGHDL
jgi:tetratricopeptide (TPR) repeat protein